MITDPSRGAAVGLVALFLRAQRHERGTQAIAHRWPQPSTGGIPQMRLASNTASKSRDTRLLTRWLPPWTPALAVLFIDPDTPSTAPLAQGLQQASRVAVAPTWHTAWAAITTQP